MRSSILKCSTFQCIIRRKTAFVDSWFWSVTFHAHKFCISALVSLVSIRNLVQTTVLDRTHDEAINLDRHFRQCKQRRKWFVSTSFLKRGEIYLLCQYKLKPYKMPINRLNRFSLHCICNMDSETSAGVSAFACSMW